MAWITENTWIISDTHFYHDNLILETYENRPAHHTELIIGNWQNSVQPDDDILHLGDVLLGGKEKRESLRYRLTGNKYLILGNHDKKTRNILRNELKFAVLPDVTRVIVNEQHIVFTHKPFEHLKSYEINIHGHTHSKISHISTDRHINVSIEVMDYSPIRLGTLLEERVK